MAIFTDDDRAVRIAEYMLENCSTVRTAAAVFGVSKSTVHKDVTARLRHENKALCEEVGKLLEINKKERHIRGGMATKHKYEEGKLITKTVHGAKKEHPPKNVDKT